MSVESTSFLRADAASVLASVSRALSDLLCQIPGDIRRPTDLQRALGVDYKLCWQVFNIVRAENPLSISQHVPSGVSMKKLLNAASKQGVRPEVVTEVAQAMKEFQEVVEAHSGDRQGFDSMVAFISGGAAAESLTIQHRRSAFRSESQLWGMQVETYLRQMILRRAPDGTLKSCFVNAKYGLRRLRREVMPIVHGIRDSSAMTGPERVRPLDPQAAIECGAPVLREFCTQPVPRFQTIQHSDGWIYSALDSDHVGRKSTVNLVFSGAASGMSLDKDDQGRPVALCGAAFIAPTELGVVELLVHRPSFGEVTPHLRILSTAAGSDVPAAMRRTQQFPIHESVAAMGPASEAGAVSDVPRYLTQLSHVFNKLEWDQSEFDLYRVRIAYPILHTSAELFFVVEDPPAH